MNRVQAESYASILADHDLMTRVRQTGRTLFADNCAGCHGTNARGGVGYPNLTTSSWIWGGDPEAMAQTIRVGINSNHVDTRTSQMPAFGRDNMLPRADIDKIVAYLQTLSGSLISSSDEQMAGKALFAANCSSCHGDDAKGKLDVGAPNLTGRHLLYGGDRQSLWDTVWNGRKGEMPTWENRLSGVNQKILVLYLMDLRQKP